MNKGFKGIVITLALVLALTLAVGLSACNETEYYSVSTECNVCLLYTSPSPRDS